MTIQGSGDVIRPSHEAGCDGGVSLQSVPVADLAPAHWDEIWGLTQAYYEVDRAYAEETLRQRQCIMLFRARRGGALIGMAAVDVHHVWSGGRPVIVIFTSHVMLHRAYRGLNLLQRAGFSTFLRMRLRYPLRPVYWFFDTFSYKSYLLLPRNFMQYWPRAGRPVPEHARALMHRMATDIYGPSWQADKGIVARSGRKRLRPDAAPLNAQQADTPALRFFLDSNPRHAAGDMLVCLCPLTAKNWLSAAMRAVQRVLLTRRKTRRPVAPDV
jgi:hypothetical protein